MKRDVSEFKFQILSEVIRLCAPHPVHVQEVAVKIVEIAVEFDEAATIAYIEKEE